MKLSFDKLFGTNLNDIQLFVLYGNDDAVIERAIDFIKYSLPHHRSEILESLDQISSHEPSLFESNPSPSLNIYKTSSEKIIKSIDLSADSKWIVIAPNLRAKSSIVIDSQKQTEILTCSCYETPLIPQELVYLSKKYDINLTPDQLRSLHQIFRTNVEALKDLLAVLAYCSPLDELQFKEFCREYSTLNENSPLNSTLLLKDHKAFLRSADQELEQDNLIPILRSLSRAIETLLAKKSGVHPLPYSVFFKDEPLYEKGLKLWSEPEAQSLLKTLLKLEHDVKFKAINPEIIIQQIQPFLAPLKH